VAAAATWVVCIMLGVLLGSAAGRPPVSELAGVDASYPVTQIAVAIAVAATTLPYLSPPVHRTVWFLVTVAVLAAISGGVLAKLWRFFVYRDSGPTLIMDRLQQVEYE
jgi:hypothetical protein